MDPFLEKKWDHAFNFFFDINRSSLLEWDDFEILIEKIRIMRHSEPEEVERTTRCLLDIWEGLLSFADLNKDNVISLQEWHLMWMSCVSNKEFPKWQETYLKYIFSLLDSSGDGWIDLSEYVETMMIYGLDQDAAEQAFDKFAVCDGRPVNAISYEQFCGLWNEFFHSRSKDAPGNHLFGAVE